MQIVTSLFENVSVKWPSDVLDGILPVFSWISLDLFSISALMCAFERQNHFRNLLTYTVSPPLNVPMRTRADPCIISDSKSNAPLS